MSALRKIKRVGKKATKFHYSATYQSVLVECHGEKWSVNSSLRCNLPAVCIFTSRSDDRDVCIYTLTPPHLLLDGTGVQILPSHTSIYFLCFYM